MNMEMPRYKSHKTVWALKIKAIVNAPPTYPERSRALEVEEAGYTPVIVNDAYMQKHDPHVGGYYVAYEDGYKSFCPAEAFLKGHHAVSTHKDRAVLEHIELSERIAAIRKFSTTATFHALPLIEQLDLNVQLDLMVKLSKVLSSRIERMD